MKIKRLLFSFIILILVIETAVFLRYEIPSVQFRSQAETDPGQTVAVKRVDPQISADGMITAQNQATLHFQTGGKMVSLPVKEGDTVRQGQTIASLDTYELSQQLQLAANTYETAKNTTAQIQENQQAGILEGQQRVALDTTNHNSYSQTPESQVITDAVKRIVDADLMAQNSAQINVQLANYAMQLATITSPISGVVTHEDVTVPYVNVTALTGFTVADPASKVFRADVTENDIDFISEGAQATIQIDGISSPITGSVVKIYPAKTTLPNGQQGYQVDIASGELTSIGKLDQRGSVLIQSNAASNLMLVPAWTVLNGQYVWVEENGREKLKHIKAGNVHGSDIEILNGLSPTDKVITNPKSIPEGEYQIL